VVATPYDRRKKGGTVGAIEPLRYRREAGRSHRSRRFEPRTRAVVPSVSN